MATWPDTVVESPDGVRTTFTTSSGLSPRNEIVVVDRLPQIRGVDYTVSGPVFTFLAGSIPQSGASILLYFLATGAPAGGTGTVSLGSLRDRGRLRADMVNSQFCTDAEINGYINSSYAELYDILIQKFGDDYFVAEPYPFTTDGTTERYPLPSDFYKQIGLDVQIGGRWQNVPGFNFGERNNSGALRSPLRARLAGGKIWLRSGGLPAQAGYSLQLWYIPKPVLLVADSDLIDGISGWEEYVVIGAAIDCVAKEESDTSQLERDHAWLMARIESAAENRNAGVPATVVDVRGASVDLPTRENP